MMKACLSPAGRIYSIPGELSETAVRWWLMLRLTAEAGSQAPCRTVKQLFLAPLASLRPEIQLLFLFQELVINFPGLEEEIVS